MKTCSDCQESLDLSLFNKNRSNKIDGLQWICKFCQKNRKKIWYEANQEAARSYTKLYYKNNTNQCKESVRSYRKNNTSKVREYKKQWNSKNPELLKNIKKREQEKNIKSYLYRNAKRRADLLLATPKWLTKEHLQAIKDIYKNCPDGYHVDHIIPLKSDFLCGLHVPWNLQYLPAKENISKKNKVIL